MIGPLNVLRSPAACLRNVGLECSTDEIANSPIRRAADGHRYAACWHFSSISYRLAVIWKRNFSTHFWSFTGHLGRRWFHVIVLPGVPISAPLTRMGSLPFLSYFAITCSFRPGPAPTSQPDTMTISVLEIIAVSSGMCLLHCCDWLVVASIVCVKNLPVVRKIADFALFYAKLDILTQWLIALTRTRPTWWDLAKHYDLTSDLATRRN